MVHRTPLLHAASWLLVLLSPAPPLDVTLIAQELVPTGHSEGAPAELAPRLAERISPGGLAVAVGGNRLEFWWVKALALGGSSAGTGKWSAVGQGTLVGVVRIAATFRDIRGKTVKPGVYTLRYGVQPVNGDHLGVSPFRDFLLLCPAAGDRDPAPLGYEGVAKLSATTIGGAHPATLSIDPPETAAGVLSSHTTELGHRALVVEVPLEGGAALRFGIVLIGKVEA